MPPQSNERGYSTVLYANDEGSTFDMDYYLTTHMPLCSKVWGPHGLIRWEVIQFTTHPDGTTPPYKVQATLHWENIDRINIILEKESKVIFDDVKHFSSNMPIFMAGTWTGTSDDH